MAPVDRSSRQPTIVHERWWWAALVGPTMLLLPVGAGAVRPDGWPLGLAVLVVVGSLLWVRPRAGAAAAAVLAGVAAVASVVLLGPWALFLLAPLTASVTVGMLLALAVTLVVGARRGRRPLS